MSDELVFIESTQLVRTVRILVWGPENAGKSHFAHSSPKPFILDFEQRAGNFADLFTFRCAQPKTFTEGVNVIGKLALPNARALYETIVVDSLTKPYNAVVKRFTTVKRSKEGGAEYSSVDWVAANRFMQAEFTDPLLAIPGKNIICVARQNVRMERNNNDFRRNGVKMSGDETRWVFDYDYVLHFAARGVIMVQKSMSPHIPVDTNLHGDMDFARFMRLVSGEEKVEARAPARRAPARAAQPAPAPAPAREQAKSDGSSGNGQLLSKIDEMLINVAAGESRRVNAIAKAKNVDEPRLLLLIAKLEGAPNVPLQSEHVEDLVTALKAEGAPPN